MSTTNPHTDSRHGLDEPPEFDLSFRFDDREDTTEVTVFPGDDEGDLATHSANRGDPLIARRSRFDALADVRGVPPEDVPAEQHWM